MKKRCKWSISEEIYIKYHDDEWGVPKHDDRRLFEDIILDGMQAGLSWLTILKKRENFRIAFDNFEPEIVAKYNQKKVNELMKNEGIVRNNLKINSAVNNAKAFLKVQEEFGSFDKYIWSFVNNKPIVNSWKSIELIPPKTDLSDLISKDLKKRGFNFVGSTIIYAFMQAIGMVNDHTTDCFRYKELTRKE